MELLNLVKPLVEALISSTVNVQPGLLFLLFFVGPMLGSYSGMRSGGYGPHENQWSAVARPEHLVHPAPLTRVMNPSMAGTVHCTTREDPQFKRWRTEVINPGAAEKEMEKDTGRW
jgi:hypothetical protein